MGLGYLNPSQIGNPEAWKHISVVAEWFESDFEVDELESEILCLQGVIPACQNSRDRKIGEEKSQFQGLIQRIAS